MKHRYTIGKHYSSQTMHKDKRIKIYRLAKFIYVYRYILKSLKIFFIFCLFEKGLV